MSALHRVSVKVKEIDNFYRSGQAYKIKCGDTTLLAFTAGGKLHVRHKGEDVLRFNPYCLAGFPNIVKQARRDGWGSIVWDQTNASNGSLALIGPQSIYGGKVPLPYISFGRYKGRVIPNGVVLTSPIDKFTGLQAERTIIMINPIVFAITDVVINSTHKLKGMTPHDVTVGAWEILTFNVPGKVMLNGLAGAPQYYAFGEPPAGTITTLSEHSFQLSLNPEGKMAEGEMYKLRGNFLTDPNSNAFALVVPDGNKTAVRIDAPVLQSVQPEGEFLDNGSSQVYWNHKYVEVENAGQAVTIAPGKRAPWMASSCTLIPSNGNLIEVASYVPDWATIPTS
jgi:hypothetical protein